MVPTYAPISYAYPRADQRYHKGGDLPAAKGEVGVQQKTQ